MNLMSKKRVWKRGHKLVSKKPKRFKQVWINVSRDGIAKRAVKLAKRDLGYEESPSGSNLQKYGEHWGENGVPWCGLAVAYWWKKAGFDISRSIALRIDYVPELEAMARKKENGFSIIHQKKVKQGDAVCFEFSSDRTSDHVGLFDRWIDKRAGVFQTIEGNTSVSSDDNGGKVMNRIRSTDQVSSFVRKTFGE